MGVQGYMAKLEPFRVHADGSIEYTTPMSADGMGEGGYPLHHVEDDPTSALRKGIADIPHVLKTVPTFFNAAGTSIAIFGTKKKKEIFRKIVYRGALICTMCGNMHPDGDAAFTPITAPGAETQVSAIDEFMYDRDRQELVYAREVEVVVSLRCGLCGRQARPHDFSTGVDLAMYAPLGTRYMSMRRKL